VVNDRKPAPVLITDAAESQDSQLRRRQIRYVIMMSVRALCLIAGAILVSTKPPLLGLWLGLCVVGMVLLPWLAVILANDRAPKKRAERGKFRAHTTARPSLPAPRDDRTIDGE
jgi:uncharacterized membrane protein